MIFGENLSRPDQFAGCGVHTMKGSQSAEAIDFSLAVGGRGSGSAFGIIGVTFSRPVVDPYFGSGLQIVADQGFFLAPLFQRKGQSIGNGKRSVTAADGLSPEQL